MANIILLEGLVEAKFDGCCYQPHIMRKGGYEARNPSNGELLIVQDKMLPHECYSSSLKHIVKYSAEQLADQDFKDVSVTLKEWLSTIEGYAAKMTANLKKLP